ncbi:hypothetical protein KIW84_015163 [Lathyrus oleraceus]|uniref:PB1-like domain-containing protein n=1 Tax=Pisum sativum TaxID=3888 RepID=A0A9D5BPJ5_PEA|nr:hypothetical protein KIW84_015163 [Pisum sativum]
MSYMDLEDMIKSEGYVNIKCLWYWNPAYSFSHGLRPLSNDQDVLQFSKDVVGYDVIDVYVEHIVGILDIIDDSELDVEDDVQCIGFKSVDVTEKVTIDPNGVVEEVTADPNGVVKEVTTDPNVVAEEVTIDPNVVVEEFTIDPNGVAEDDVTTDPTVVAEEGTTDIDEDYIASEGSFEDREFQFSEESEESEMDWTKKNVFIKKNDSKRIVVKCTDSCKFYMRLRKRIGNQFWQVVTLIEDHTCHVTADNKSAKIKWLSNKFASILRHPGLELKEVLWVVAMETTVPTWEREMLRMKATKEDAWKDMLDVPSFH